MSTEDQLCDKLYEKKDELKQVLNNAHNVCDEIETLISKLIEEAVGTVNKIKRINSTSREGVSLVIPVVSSKHTMRFVPTAHTEEAFPLQTQLIHAWRICFSHQSSLPPISRSIPNHLL